MNTPAAAAHLRVVRALKPISRQVPGPPLQHAAFRLLPPAAGTARTVAFNVQGFRIAVHRVTGRLEILQSVHAADAGMVINPIQCGGQIEGAVAQGLGSSIFERMEFNEKGEPSSATFRTYRIPSARVRMAHNQCAAAV